MSKYRWFNRNKIFLIQDLIFKNSILKNFQVQMIFVNLNIKNSISRENNNKIFKK